MEYLVRVNTDGVIAAMVKYIIMLLNINMAKVMEEINWLPSMLT